MPVPAVDADKRGDAYKKVKPVEGIDEQGLVPDPQVMHVLFARLMAALTQRVRAQPVGPVPSCVRLRVVVKFGALPPASEQPPVPGIHWLVGGVVPCARGRPTGAQQDPGGPLRAAHSPTSSPITDAELPRSEVLRQLKACLHWQPSSRRGT